MHIHPSFDPIAIHLGPLAVRWYGPDVPRRVHRGDCRGPGCVCGCRIVAAQGWTVKDIDDMLFYGVLGTILGGRLGYVPVLQGELLLCASAGHLQGVGRRHVVSRRFLGVTLAMVLFAWQRGRTWLEVNRLRRADGAHRARRRPARQLHQRRVMGPCHRSVGALGDAVSHSPPARTPGGLATHPQQAAQWNLGEVYAQYHMLPRHPSELYEIALEGVVLFFVLWFLSRANASGRGRIGGHSDRLRIGPLYRRICARAG